MRRSLVFIALLCAALVLAATASAAKAPVVKVSTTKLGWVEKLDKDPATRMTFTIASYGTVKGGWTVKLSITNTGKGAITINRKQFGLAEFDTKSNFTKPTRYLAGVMVPAIPAKLAPGKTWKGVMTGPGTPNQHLFLRMVFGSFTSTSSPTPFQWITDHAQHVFEIAA